MAETNIYDEVLKIKNYKCDDEIAKYYINEEMFETDRITYIIKKGFSIQKSALIKNLPDNLNNKDIIEFTIKSLIEYIEIWDENLQIEFANSIYKIFFINSISDIYNYDFYFNSNNQHLLFINIKEKDQKDILTIYYNTQSIINLLLKFIMKMISNGDEKNIITLEYIRTFNIIIKFFCYYKKIKIENSVIDFGCNMGTFGKSVLSRRYCVYFCSCLIQISENYDSELFNRFMILSSDSDKSIRIETAFNMRFICKELEENFIKRNLIKTIENYLSEDDIIIKTEVFISVMCNFRKFFDEVNLNFINFFMNKITNFMETCFNYNLAYKIYLSILNEYFDSFREYNNFILTNTNNILTNMTGINLSNINYKSFLNIIKIFIKRFILSPSNLPDEQIVYDTLLYYFELSKIIEYHKEHQITHEFINFIINKSENSILCNMIFFQNFLIISNSTPREIRKKLILPKFINAINNNISYLFPIIIKYLSKILHTNIYWEDLIDAFVDKFENFANLFKNLNTNFHQSINFNLNILNINVLNTFQNPNNSVKFNNINTLIFSNHQNSLNSIQIQSSNLTSNDKNLPNFCNGDNTQNNSVFKKNPNPNSNVNNFILPSNISNNQKQANSNITKSNTHNTSNNSNYNRNSNGNYSFSINLNNPNNSLNNQNNLNKSHISNDIGEISLNMNNFVNDSFIQRQNFQLHLAGISNLLSQSNWRILIIFLENIKECDFLFLNSDFTIKYLNFLIRTWKDENVNIPTKKTILETFPLILKFSFKNDRDEIFHILQKEIIESKSFYDRRLFFPFFESSIKIFSVNYLINNHIIENYLKFFEDNIMIQVKCLRYLKDIYPLIPNESKLKAQITIKIKELKKNTCDTEIKNNLIEYEEWLNQFENNLEIEDYKILISKENEKKEIEKALFLKEQKIVNERKSKVF